MNWFKQSPTPEEALDNALNFTEQFKKYAKEQKCPACNQIGNFKVSMAESGQKGWEIHFACDCGLTAILNNTGFHFIGRQTTQ